MLNQTHRALEDFDNQHDFERMAADILNGLGYSNVEPMAPRGGADGGQDIRFKEGDVPYLHPPLKAARSAVRRSNAKDGAGGGNDDGLDEQLADDAPAVGAGCRNETVVTTAKTLNQPRKFAAWPVFRPGSSISGCLVQAAAQHAC